MKKIVVGMTGASGSIYCLRLLEALAKYDCMVHVIATANGKMVCKYETDVDLYTKVEELKAKGQKIQLEDNHNLFSSVASGSYVCDSMVILPCSMSTIAELNSGITKTLLTRAADVFMKEKRNLVVVPRESPFSTIHLKNMYDLSNMGVRIVPAMPGFYNHPASMEDMIDFVVGKALDALGIHNMEYKRWEGDSYENYK